MLKKQSEIIRILDATSSLRKLLKKEVVAGKNVMRQCMGVKRKEQVLIVTDEGKLEEAAIFFEIAKNFSPSVKLVQMASRNEHGEEPPEMIARELLSCDVALLVTSKSLSHTSARRRATKKGVRIASMPEITKDIIIRTLSADYQEIKKSTEKLANILTKGRKVRITSKKGTELIMEIRGRACESDNGIYRQPGKWGNLPAGEACLAPLEETTNGIAVIDGNSYIPEVPLDRNLIFEIKGGFIRKVRGGKAAQALKRKFQALGKNARNIAELGVGTNPLAQLGPNILEIEKVYGTVHIGIGNNISYGGRVNVPFHSDGVILCPTLEVDGKIILKNGKFKI